MNNYKMKIRELNCDFHMPDKLTSRIINGEEVAHGLPPCAPVEAYSVDKYPGCPDNWMNGSDIASSYFLGVEEDKGMWLNFNDCFHHKYHVAVVISIQGVNPITGQRTDKLRLEKYQKNCPIHNKAFQTDRFCPDCEYDWPAQNYLSTTGTQWGLLWLDGFRTPDGKVRQYIFTAEEMKSIASQLIGKDRVFAIGIAFYLSKKEKQKKQERHFETSSVQEWGSSFVGQTMSDEFGPCAASGIDDTAGGLCSPKNIGSVAEGAYSVASNYVNQVTSDTSRAKILLRTTAVQKTEDHHIRLDGIEKNCAEIKIGSKTKPSTEMIISKKVKKLEVGAGALIRQEINEDPEEMDFWKPEPYGMIYINYCTQDVLKQILDKGSRKEAKEGYMKDLKVGG